MTKTRFSQAQVAGEERRTGKCQQQRKNHLTSHAFVTEVQADLPKRNAPTAQQLALALQDVLSRTFTARVVTLPARGRALGTSLGPPARPPRQLPRYCCLATLRRCSAKPSTGDLLQHIGHQNPSATKGRRYRSSQRLITASISTICAGGSIPSRRRNFADGTANIPWMLKAPGSRKGTGS